jgi:hypothetical protein
MSAWVYFLDYTNLPFVLTGALDRIAYNAGEQAQAEIHVATFAGRPAEGMTLMHHDDRMPNLSTDANGTATGTLPIRAEGDEWHWHPFWNAFWYALTGDTDTPQGISLPYITVPRNVMLEYELEGDTMTVATHEILTDRINEFYQDAHPWSHIEPDVFRGPPVDTHFAIIITRHVTTRTVRSQQYDHINSRMITTYNFHTEDIYYGTVYGHAENGHTVITGLPVSDDPYISYSMNISYRDANGHSTLVWVWVPGNWIYFQPAPSLRQFNFLLENTNLAIGESLQAAVTENPNSGMHGGWDRISPEPLSDGRLLTVLVRDGVIASAAGSPQGVPLTFTEACVSNAVLYGAYFDGRYVFPIEHPAVLTFDYNERALDMTLRFDRAQYRPGDEVTVNIQTEPGAQVLVSVVDESSLLGQAHEARFLTRLYQSSSRYWWTVRYAAFASHTQHNFGGEDGYADGWGGNGGDDGLGDGFRDTFTDNPVFETVRTDSNGRGTLTFTLPHQITSWRVTALGLTPGGHAGDIREHIISTLDFYVDLLLTPDYIPGDDIVAAARAYGAGNGPVDFTFNILQNGATLMSHRHNRRAPRRI